MRFEQLVHRDLPVSLVRLVVGVDQVLIDGVGDRDRQMFLTRLEAVGDAGLLLVGQQADSSEQGAADSVERVPATAAVSARILLHALCDTR